MSTLESLSQRLGYQFKNSALLECALTHRSVPEKNNERLEFLGDSVLNFMIANELFLRHPHANEGELSRMRSILVNGEMLAQFAVDLDLSEGLRLGVGEMKSGGRYRSSILADALEAVIGAIYLDAGLEACRNCVLKWYGERFEDLSTLTAVKDAKSKLQEWLQARKLPLPEYGVEISGAAHAQTFRVKCQVKGFAFVAEGSSTNRRKAEQEAAQRFLEILNEYKRTK